MRRSGGILIESLMCNGFVPPSLLVALKCVLCLNLWFITSFSSKIDSNLKGAGRVWSASCYRVLSVSLPFS